MNNEEYGEIGKVAVDIASYSVKFDERLEVNFQSQVVLGVFENISMI